MCSFESRTRRRLLSYQSLHRIILTCITLSGCLLGQTSSTGAIHGQALDPSNAALGGVLVRLITKDGREAESVQSDDSGGFELLSLPPGGYTLRATKNNFAPLSLPNIQVVVTETLRVELHFQLEARLERAQISSNASMIQLDTSALGRAVNRDSINGLPLATRNFTQIAGLSPGVAVAVYNAGELGIGATAQSQINKSNDGIYAHGARS